MFLRTWYVKRAVRLLGLDTSGDYHFLDAGVGFGQYAAFLFRMFSNAHILGLDIDADLVETGNAFAGRWGEGRMRFEATDLTRMEYTDAFDLILCVDVLEHIEEDETLLSLFSKALKPKGRLVLTMPTVYRKHGEDGTFVEEHARPGYAEEEIRTKVKQAGLEIVSLEYAYGFWGDLAWRLGIRNSMKLMGLGRIGVSLGAIYLTVTMPLALMLMAVDFASNNRRGTGLVLVAGKVR